MPTIRRSASSGTQPDTAASRYCSPPSGAEGFGHALLSVAEQTGSRKRFLVPPQGCGRWTASIFHRSGLPGCCADRRLPLHAVQRLASKHEVGSCRAADPFPTPSKIELKPRKPRLVSAGDGAPVGGNKCLIRPLDAAPAPFPGPAQQGPMAGI